MLRTTRAVPSGLGHLCCELWGSGTIPPLVEFYYYFGVVQMIEELQLPVHVFGVVLRDNESHIHRPTLCIVSSQISHPR